MVFQQKTSICVVRLLLESFYSMLSVVRVQPATLRREKFDVNVSDVSSLHLAHRQRCAVSLLLSRELMLDY